MCTYQCAHFRKSVEIFKPLYLSHSLGICKGRPSFSNGQYRVQCNQYLSYHSPVHDCYGRKEVKRSHHFRIFYGYKIFILSHIQQAAYFPAPGNTSYASGKAFLSNMATCLAIEGKRKEIKILGNISSIWYRCYLSYERSNDDEILREPAQIGCLKLYECVFIYSEILNSQ
jgi:hypothetical protein